jgi:hypothetical protein
MKRADMKFLPLIPGLILFAGCATYHSFFHQPTFAEALAEYSRQNPGA